jgi:hypothetical protein
LGASHILSPKDYIFPNLRGDDSDGEKKKDSTAAHMTKFLRKCYEGCSELRNQMDEWFSLSAYSLRRGGATTASQGLDGDYHAILGRGGWKGDGAFTLFGYIAYGKGGDNKVSRLVVNFSSHFAGIVIHTT